MGKENTPPVLTYELTLLAKLDAIRNGDLTAFSISPYKSNMLANILIGFGVMAICVVIQCFTVATLLQFFQRHIEKHPLTPTISRTAALLSVAMLIMFFGNLIQIAVWSQVFISLGEFDNFTTAFYHSAVNFSSLGYGDIVMSEKRKLLGALEAGSGVLMFGLTTSFLYSIVGALARRKREQAETEITHPIKKIKTN